MSNQGYRCYGRWTTPTRFFHSRSSKDLKKGNSHTSHTKVSPNKKNDSNKNLLVFIYKKADIKSNNPHLTGGEKYHLTDIIRKVSVSPPSHVPMQHRPRQ